MSCSTTGRSAAERAPHSPASSPTPPVCAPSERSPTGSGAPGQAYVHDDASHAVRRMIVLDPATGAVLGLQDTVTRGSAEFGVEAGDVMSYAAWLR